VTLVPFIGFALVALLAVGFATFSLLRSKSVGRAYLAGALALFLLGVGGGTYFMVGQPGLATRDAQGLGTRDIKGLIPFLIKRVHQQPGDLQAWAYLGSAYMSVGDANDASKAYGRAVTVARLRHMENADLDATYGETVVETSGGAVTEEAQGAFQAALKLQPQNAAARFFLGEARAQHGDIAGAQSLWQGLLAETPASSPLHQTLVDRLAMLAARSKGGAPDPRAMVAMLAAQLKADPNNEAGWRRLIRAYTVLGEPDQAKAALASARNAFAKDKTVLAALDADAKDLKLN
jgi:cytochrome c-type biogenesis protein CcmH